MVFERATAGGAALLATTALGALAIGASSALAGGFAVREQSAYSQGASFAGSAANGQLSGMYWNSAEVTSRSGGLNFDSNYSLIVPNAELTVDSVTGPSAAGILSSSDNDAEIGKLAVVPASYVNYQFVNYDPRLYIGLGVNAPFGLSTKPDDVNYQGSVLARKSDLFTMNFNPVIGYKLSEQLAIGVGVQVQYNDGELKFATGLPSGPNTFFSGNGFGIGATAGVTWTPAAGTRIGLGYRSALDVELDGHFATNPGTPGLGAGPSALAAIGTGATVDLKLPDIVTLSIQQAIAPNMRVLGTFEWTNWSRFEELRVISEGSGFALLPTPGFPAAGTTIGAIPANWHDGYFAALGFEYDYSKQLTLRTGAAYEWSPIQNPSERIIGIPDANRVWVSAGFTYNLSAKMSLDFAYTHIFVEDARFSRELISDPNTTIAGTLDASADIVSVALRSRW